MGFGRWQALSTFLCWVVPALGGCLPAGDPGHADPAPHQAIPTPALQSAAPPGEQAPDLVLVLLSGLRADAAGEGAAEVAFLEPFAGRLRLVTSAAYAQSPDPQVSLGSLLAGRYPSAVPLCGSARRGEVSELQEAWCHQLPAEVELLPEVLAHYGYRTALFHHLDPLPGLAEGFQHSEALESTSVEGVVSWQTLQDQLGAWWVAAEGGPRLLVLQLSQLDLAGRPDLLTAVGLEAAGETSGEMAFLSGSGRSGRGRGADDGRLLPRRPACESLQGQQRALSSGWDLGSAPSLHVERQGEELRLLHRSEAALVGERVSGLLAGLPGERERYLFLAGLHGISIAELGGTESNPGRVVWSDRVLDRTVHVPLAVVGPGGGPPVVLEQPTELVDLMPTLLALAGVVPPHGLAGQDLLDPTLREDLESETAYVEYGDMLALRRGDHLLSMRAMVHNMTSLDPYLTEVLLCPGLLGGFSLHDVRADPLQVHDLVADQPELALELEQVLIQRRTGPGAPPPRLFDGDRLLRLRLMRAEGYW